MTDNYKKSIQEDLEKRKQRLEEYNEMLEGHVDLMGEVAKALGRVSDAASDSIVGLYKLKGVYEGNIRVLELMLKLADDIKDD